MPFRINCIIIGVFHSFLQVWPWRGSGKNNHYSTPVDAKSTHLHGTDLPQPAGEQFPPLPSSPRQRLLLSPKAPGAGSELYHTVIFLLTHSLVTGLLDPGAAANIWPLFVERPDPLQGLGPPFPAPLTPAGSCEDILGAAAAAVHLPLGQTPPASGGGGLGWVW